MDVKSIKDLEAIMGKKLAQAICAKVSASGNVQRKPRSVRFYESKPKYYLNDGNTLTFYAVDLIDQKIVSETYGGSADTVMHHPGAQLSEGQTTDRDAVFAVTKYWNGSNMSWSLDIISSNLVKQLAMTTGV